ncbi:PREDICTED: pyridoxine/pyridoxamine 5'-phosphate oxidase isoform X2 [Eufriesea mexicana]|uniref:pyridoxine/pyridoxamine 5'-phosphate oxidase isoform X2 n=1 Tax=Eufriesea mexicana TaxID=516756 RepID=UPI00083C0EDF|nr:PREDICTED: pyridoxine/pyridoxamine 5'-phosphate oxidase isoform X2 [Eufriesea mexicana]
MGSLGCGKNRRGGGSPGRAVQNLAQRDTKVQCYCTGRLLLGYYFKRLRFRDCKVSARNVILREFDDDGFTIVTDNRSKKIDNVENISYAAMCFLWFYVNDQDQKVTKQVRIEGTMKRLDSEQYKHLYDREPLFCKIRSHVCDQGRVVDWEDLKRRHDEILDSVRRGENDLPMPDHFVGYKLFPTMMEFYFARDYLIGDRILYRKDTSNDAWERHRISA